jgi:hypothetical protein
VILPPQARASQTNARVDFPAAICDLFTLHVESVLQTVAFVVMCAMHTLSASSPEGTTNESASFGGGLAVLSDTAQAHTSTNYAK